MIPTYTSKTTTMPDKGKASVSGDSSKPKDGMNRATPVEQAVADKNEALNPRPKSGSDHKSRSS